MFDIGEGLVLSSNIKSYTDKVKNAFDRVTRPFTSKKDSKISGRIYPLFDIGKCKYVINKYPTLQAVIRVLAVDVVYNEYNFRKVDDSGYLNEELTQFWNENKSELKKAVEDNLGYGYGAMEITYDMDTLMPRKLQQIPAETVTIVKKRIRNKDYHYAYYENETDRILFRITREKYDDISIEEDKSAGYVIWLGGGNESRWYDKPIWTSAYLDILTAIRKKELDYYTISNDNIPKSVLFIEGPPDNPQNGEDSVYESLRKQFRKSGGGVAISYLETPLDADILKTEYVKIQDDNYDYLNNLIDRTDNVLLELYRVPKIRLMIDNSKESLNSNKSQTLYEIYTLDLESYQYPIEEEIDIFTHMYWEENVYSEIKTPIFVDNKQIQVKTIADLYDIGIFTLKDALLRIKALYPDHDWSEIDWDSIEINQRFYHGMLFSTPGIDTGMRNVIGANMRGMYQNEDVYDEDDNEGQSGQQQSAVNFYGS